jgi:topoisomerase IA-like protein
LKGPHGPYLRTMTEKAKKPVNYKIPDGIDPQKITKEQVSEIISQKKTVKKKYGGSKTDGKGKQSDGKGKQIGKKKQITKNE